MPEMPEVETMVRDLAPLVTGRTISTVEAAFPGIVVYPGYEEFTLRVAGRKIERVDRRGKYAILPLDSGDLLIVHRGMTGSLLRRRPEDELEPYVRILFRLDDGTELRLNDPRKFGKVYVMDAAGGERPLPWAVMGPEPLDEEFTVETFARALRGRTALIKPLLLNQRIVAGLGNIYVDEALFRAGIHPTRAAGSLTPDEIARLHAAIREVLSTAIEQRGTTFNNYTDIEGRRGGYQTDLLVFRRTGEPCPRCGTPIARSVVQGRGTHTCPNCQGESRVTDHTA